MEKFSPPIYVFSFSFFFISFPQFLQSHASLEYIRPPPRSIISTPHRGSDSDPQQVHVSLVGIDHARISWITDDKKVPSIVEYGLTPGNYEGSATGEHEWYHYFFYSSGKIHHVKIGPLNLNTIYYYRCGGTGQEFSFKTPPPTFPIEFAIVGDLGQTEWTASTLAHVGEADYDVLLLPGDISYADTQQPLWDSFGRFVQPYASRRPWMVTQGNHEVETYPIFEHKPFKAYNARWRMPFEESGSTSNLYYSFDVAAGVHIIMLGSYTDFNADSDQYKWLQADLANVDRVQTPWLVVLLHAPWYNTNTAHEGEGESMRKAMEGLLYQARVDIVFTGHVHAYERFTRIYNNKINQCGPVHVTIGDGGNREGLALMFKDPPSPLSLFREASFGHGRLRVFNQTHALWSWHRNNDREPLMADQVWLESLSMSSVCMKPSIISTKDEL
ncbi:purple acid phosphatase 22-like [Telopea speciosissima]|uniref:purple acid phosphatase 22-like n=1 Tax=Telopea speciosissima TaxID=54955 RepID=UPI001CC4B6C3|nr:purple acid phosphatase 22-like [Telopea speciosissima]